MQLCYMHSVSVFPLFTIKLEKVYLISNHDGKKSSETIETRLHVQRARSTCPGGNFNWFGELVLSLDV